MPEKKKVNLFNVNKLNPIEDGKNALLPVNVLRKNAVNKTNIVIPLSYHYREPTN